jgi:hypothetical protein
MAVFPPVLRPFELSDPLLEVPLGRLPAAEDEELAAEEAEEPRAAVVVEGVKTEVTTTVMGALDEPPFWALSVTTWVMSWVEAGCEEADTIEVTTFVEEGSTVTVLAIWVADEKTSDETDAATTDEKDDWAAFWLVERNVDDAGVVITAISLSVADKDDGARPLYL